MVGKVEIAGDSGQLTTVVDSLLRRLTLANAGQFERLLENTSGEQDHVECVYVLDACGTQITPTIVPRFLSRAGVLFQPALEGSRPFPQGLLLRPPRSRPDPVQPDPYVSLASGHLCRTLNTAFRDRRAEIVRPLHRRSLLSRIAFLAHSRARLPAGCLAYAG